MKAMVGLVIAILIIFGYRLFWPSADIESETSIQEEIEMQGEVVSEPVAEKESAEEILSSALQLNAPSDSEKRKLMRAEYEILEQARKELKSHIGLLKHQMWGLTFPSATARDISKTVMGANKLLKNPHMLGAFSSVEQIKDEVAKIEFAEKSLEEIDTIVKAKIEETAANEELN